MPMRVRYFPAIFLALVVSLILLIPYYYLDTWVTVPLLRVIEDTSWRPHPGQQSSLPPIIAYAPIPVNRWESSGQQNGSNRSEILPQVAPPLRNDGQYNFMHFRANAMEFALRMAKDRLRIERFGLRRFTNRTALERNAISGDSDQYDNEQESSGNNSTDTSPLQVLIVTYFRGGTTFFGDLLNQYPGTYYHFEPLHTISYNDQVQGPEQISESIRMLRHLLRCQYESVPSYINWVRQDDHRFLFEHNHRLWLGCQFQPHLCYLPKFLSSMCKLHPIHVFKLVRLRLAYVKRLIDEFPNLQVIYLVRDPRGLYSSRRDLGWCNVTRSCIDPYVYCADMRNDLSTALAMRRKYPDRFMAMRYEDLALNPKSQLEKVLHQLKLTYNGKLERFIESHTRLNTGEIGGGPYSTKRDSRKAAFSWRRKLSPHEVDYVESACSDVIKQLSLP